MSEAAALDSSSSHAGWYSDLNRIQRPALMIGAAGILLTVIGLFVDPDHQFRSYIWAFCYWMAIPLGSLALLMLQHMTGGTWGLVMRRFLEASSWLLVIMFVFALPIILAVAVGKYTLYPWLAEVDGHQLLGHAANPAHLSFKKLWLSPNFFIFRTVAYFTIWISLAIYLYGWSGREDRNGSTPETAYRARVVSAPGIVLYFLTTTFASVDWVMSIDPAWYSTMFAVLFVIGQGLVTMAFTILIIFLLSKRQPLRELLSPALLNDLGNLMFAFLLLWAYTNFSQFLIIWSGNIAEETPYYHFRNRGSWGAVALFLVIFHFFAPFMLLLWRRVKRDIRTLAMVAVAILIVRSVDLFWVVKPMFFQRTVWAGDLTAKDHKAAKAHPTTAAASTAPAATPAHSEESKSHDIGAKSTPNLSEVPVNTLWEGFNLTDLPAIAGIGGIWVAAFVWKLKQRPVLPPNDPRLAELCTDIIDDRR